MSSRQTFIFTRIWNVSAISLPSTQTHRHSWSICGSAEGWFLKISTAGFKYLWVSEGPLSETQCYHFNIGPTTALKMKMSVAKVCWDLHFPNFFQGRLMEAEAFTLVPASIATTAHYMLICCLNSNRSIFEMNFFEIALKSKFLNFSGFLLLPTFYDTCKNRNLYITENYIDF